MALSVRATAAGGGTTSTGNRTVAITPAVNDVFVVFVNTANTNVKPTMTDDNGGTYTLVTVATIGSPVTNVHALFIRNERLANTTSTTITATTGSNTAGELVVYAIAGSAIGGPEVISQFAAQGFTASAGTVTPAPSFSWAVATGNMTLGSIANLSNPAALTPPTSWNEEQDTGQNSPATGIETVSRGKRIHGHDDHLGRYVTHGLLRDHRRAQCRGISGHCI